MGGEEREEIEVVHSWSAPRSLSTSIMYSFAQRDDMEVLDELLYATFLRATGIERPYQEELLSQMESDGDKVVKEIIYGPGRKKYQFCKHMANQWLLGLPKDLMKKGKHFILKKERKILGVYTNRKGVYIQSENFYQYRSICL